MGTLYEAVSGTGGFPETCFAGIARQTHKVENAGVNDGTHFEPAPKPLPADQRPVDPTKVDTADLPPTPLRDRNIPAFAWRQAPAELLAAGDDIDQTAINYKRRIGPWLLWRAGPAVKADARYVAILAEDLTRIFSFRLFPDGTGDGIGPSGARHERFRTWKEDLRDHE